MSNNRIILNGCIDQFRSQNELNTTDSETFELFSLTQIHKEYDLSYENIETSIVDGGNDGGIDSIIVMVDDTMISSIEDLDDIAFKAKTELKLLISQCKKENSFKELVIDRLITTIPELFNLERSEDALLVRFNPDLVQKGCVAREAWKRCSISGGKIQIILSYCCNAEKIETNDVFNDKVSQLKEQTKANFVGASVEYINYSCKELLTLYQKHPNLRLSLVFKQSPLSTSYLDSGIGYVGVVNLNDYKHFITDDDGSIRDYLFESNIRHYQGLVDVNKKIKDTIENQIERDFWWLNNGITIIASNPTQVDKTLSIDNVQIVNGLQTSYSIFNNYTHNQNDNRSVLVKVIINEDKETIDNIIASTNSQNPVSPSLLRATDEVQRNIELFFLNEGYYYDRRKSYYKNIGKPASKIFGIQTVAQSIESILFNSPHTARSKPTSLIKDENIYRRIFDANRDFKAYLNCCLIYKLTNENWREIEDESMKSKTANFKLHLARIWASLHLHSNIVTFENIVTFDLENVDRISFNAAVNLLGETIDQYLNNNQEANLINIAKTKSFTDQLNLRIKAYFERPAIDTDPNYT